MRRISRRIGLPASALALLTVGFVASAGAAPVGGVAELKTQAGENVGIEQVRHRCYRHRGHWHCPSHHRYYRYDYGPGLYFHFGPRRHFQHRRHRHY